MLPLDPFGDEHARPRVGGHHDRRRHEAEELEARLEALGVRRLDRVVDLLQDVLRDAIQHRPHVAAVRIEAAEALDEFLRARHRQDEAEVILRQYRHRVGALHLHRHLEAVVQRRLVHLAQRRDGDGRRADLGKERRRVGRVGRVDADAGRDRAHVAEVLLEDRPRERVVERRVRRLQPLQRRRRLVAHQVGPLRERLRHLDAQRAERRQPLAQQRAAPAARPVVAHVLRRVELGALLALGDGRRRALPLAPRARQRAGHRGEAAADRLRPLPEEAAQRRPVDAGAQRVVLAPRVELRADDARPAGERSLQLRLQQRRRRARDGADARQRAALQGGRAGNPQRREVDGHRPERAERRGGHPMRGEVERRVDLELEIALRLPVKTATSRAPSPRNSEMLGSCNTFLRFQSERRSVPLRSSLDVT